MREPGPAAGSGPGGAGRSCSNCSARCAHLCGCGRALAVRLLAKGELTTVLSFTVDGASKGAIEAVEKIGGKVEVIHFVPAAEKAAAKKGVKYKERAAHKASFKA